MEINKNDLELDKEKGLMDVWSEMELIVRC